MSWGAVYPLPGILVLSHFEVCQFSQHILYPHSTLVGIMLLYTGFLLFTSFHFLLFFCSLFLEWEFLHCRTISSHYLFRWSTPLLYSGHLLFLFTCRISVHSFWLLWILILGSWHLLDCLLMLLYLTLLLLPLPSKCLRY